MTRLFLRRSLSKKSSNTLPSDGSRLPAVDGGGVPRLRTRHLNSGRGERPGSPNGIHLPPRWRAPRADAGSPSSCGRVFLCSIYLIFFSLRGSGRALRGPARVDT